MTPWFIKSKGTFTISRKELPIDIDEITRMADPSQPRTFMQALMQTLPNQPELWSEDLGNPIRDAIIDCIDLLTEQDKFVINSIFWEQLSYSELGERMRCVKTACLEIDTGSTRKSQRAAAHAQHTEGLHTK